MNSAAKAKMWTEFLSLRPEIKNGELILAQFNEGTITDICQCGCNGYSFTLNSNSKLQPLMPPSQKGSMAAMLNFYTQIPNQTIEFILFTDANGNLSGIDVDCNGNTSPVPTEVKFIEPPFHIYGPLTCT